MLKNICTRGWGSRKKKEESKLKIMSNINATITLKIYLKKKPIITVKKYKKIISTTQYQLYETNKFAKPKQ